MNVSSQDEMVEDLCRQADASYRSGDIQGARQIYEAVLQLDGGHERALEGLALTSLTDTRWSMVDGAAGQAAALASGLARVRELLSSEQLEAAATAADELLRQNRGNPAVEALVEEVRAARQRAPRIARALAEAREALAKGAPDAAVAACRNVLELEPGHREAELLQEQAELALHPGVTDPGPVSLELDLDLALERMAPPPAAPPVPPPVAQRTQPITVVAPPVADPPAAADPWDVADPGATAADRFAGWDLEPAQDPAPPAVEPGGWDADLLGPVVPPSGADCTFDASDLGREFGDRPRSGEGTADLLDAARDLNEEREVEPHDGGLATGDPVNAGEGEAALLLARARDEFENGRLDDARNLAARALTLDERVAGGQELLDEVQAVAERAAREADDLLNQAIAEHDRGRPELAIPLLSQVLTLAPGHPEALEYLERAEAMREAQGVGRHDLPAGDAAGVEHVESIPLLRPTVPAPEKPSAVPSPPPLGAAAPAAASPAPPATGGLGSAPAGRTAGKTAAPKKVKRSIDISKPVGIVIGLAIVAGLGAGARWATRSFFGGSATAPAVERPVRRAAIKPAAEPAAAAPVAAVAVPTKADIPDLVSKAGTLLRTGGEAEAVQLLERARGLDPTDIALSEQLAKARSLLREREEAERAISDAKANFAREDFEEALRIFYRLPEGKKPANLTRWIANGWYNAGVQRLLTSDFAEAREFFGNCLEVQPNDEGARRNLEVIKRYAGKATDDAFRIYVKGLTLRTLDQM